MACAAAPGCWSRQFGAFSPWCLHCAAHDTSEAALARQKLHMIIESASSSSASKFVSVFSTGGAVIVLRQHAARGGVGASQSLLLSCAARQQLPAGMGPESGMQQRHSRCPVRTLGMGSYWLAASEGRAHPFAGEEQRGVAREPHTG